ncbi:amidohydrolase family protein [Actinomadura namibiensis]|uniref:Imidazolonepropionase-like amidohydrolase n=1 Tax=Actinomadura namibiensis TaxID=182080 RepID=A0A7W3LLK7_ACTNM|nr:amidohydrolase family protein [Actinomadura namibiensis]MBA8950379.1 imidazolonepropionase-like amidohydrolase [Actinomadura namibiensis]
MDRVALRAARVFDGERVLDGPVVVFVEDGRVLGVERGTAVPDGWPTRDLPGGTLLPGLIDAHVHLCADGTPGPLDRLAGHSAERLDATIEASLRAHLAAGVTTVRDLGDQDGAVLSWSSRATAGLPTVLGSGAPITTPGGHCRTMGGAARGVAELRAAVRRRAGQGAHVVKIMGSGGVMTPGTDTMRPQFTDEEMRAAVAEAHAAGLPVTVHAHALAAVRQAVDAGADGIEHCTCLTPSGVRVDDDLLGALAGAGVVVCPTLGSDPGFTVPPEIVAMAARAGLTQEALNEVVARLHAGGVRLVAGTDAGIGPPKPHGLLPVALREYAGCGMPATDVLAAATSAAAAACGVADRKGFVRPGHDADLLAVDGDPATDITALARPLAVYLAGTPVAAA